MSNVMRLPTKNMSQYLLGLSLGVIPAVLWLFSLFITIPISGYAFMWLILLAYGSILCLSTICLLIFRVQFIGAGLFTAVVLDPAIYVASIYIWYTYFATPAQRYLFDY